MANMSYCRFGNTLGDLQDCYRALQDIDSVDELSDDERSAALRLVKLCGNIAANYDDGHEI